MKHRILSLLTLASALTVAAHGQTYFHEPFDADPVITGSNAAVNGAWYWDRYRPANFDSVVDPTDPTNNVLRIGIDQADGIPPNGTPGRPGAYLSTFYNTQGRQFQLGNPVNSRIAGRLYVASDWASNRRRSDIWGVPVDGSNSVSGYPILGIANVGSGLVCRAFVQDTDFNPGNGYAPGWVDLSSLVPGGLTTDRWYHLEIRLRPNSYEFVVDGKVLLVDTITFGSVAMKAIIMQAYNFNDPSLTPPAQGTNESYEVYWDDLIAGPIAPTGQPVDLNGTYHSPSTRGLNPLVGSTSGLASALTRNLGFGQVFERSATPDGFPAENVVNGTFTPFNEATKVPSSLEIPDANGTSIKAKVALSGTWKPFQWGQGIGFTPPFATGDTFAIGWINTFNSFGVQFVQNLSGQYVARIASTRLLTGSLATLETNGSPAVLPAGTTEVLVEANVVGGFLTASVTAMNGPATGTTYPLGTTNGSDMDTNVPWTFTVDDMGLVAGFETHENPSSKAYAAVSDFTTNATSNLLFAFADDPYVKGAEGIEYRVGQANMAQAVAGYQAFMAALAGQTFVAGAYNPEPYTDQFPASIDSTLDFAAASESVANTDNLLLALLGFSQAGETATGIGFEANSGTRQNLFAGAAPDFLDILANTRGSNTVLVDNTAPSMTAPILGDTGWNGTYVVVGTLAIVTEAKDLGAQRSGLNSRPVGTITWSDSTTTSVEFMSQFGNFFQGRVPITSSTPNGPAVLTVEVCDRAGNCTVTTTNLTVSTVVLTLEIEEKGLFATANRAINISVGGSGGANAPVTVKKLVSFTTPTVDGHKGTVVVNYADLDTANGGSIGDFPPAAALTHAIVKDPFFSLAKKEALTGSGGQYTGSFSLTLGDLTNNDIVNVSDLAVWAANNGTSMSKDTTVAQAATPRQANLDGLPNVNLGDRNVLLQAWLLAGDSSLGLGNFNSFGPSRNNGRIRVAEVARETGLALRVVHSMDLNADGWLDRDEVLTWSKGGKR